MIVDVLCNQTVSASGANNTANVSIRYGVAVCVPFLPSWLAVPDMPSGAGLCRFAYVLLKVCGSLFI